MADLMSIPPTEDPLDSALFIENALRFWDDTNQDVILEPQNLVQEQEPDYTNPQWVPETTGYELQNVVESSNPSSIEDLLFLDIDGEENGNNNADQTGGIGTQNIDDFLNLDQENTNTIPLAIWPMPPVPFGCSFCQVLREVIHTNGTETTKLEIHGRIGIFCHAILETRCNVDGLPSIEHQMIDFSNQTMESVKQFLVQYCQDRKRTGFVSLQDPLWTFYDTLGEGLDWDKNSPSTDGIFQPSNSQPESIGVCQSNRKADKRATGFPKSNLAAQRERTGRLRLSDLADYFHLKIEEAAERLDICPTVLKKICRRNGMKRWPYRKIRSLDRKILILQKTLQEKDGEGSAQVHAQIERLRHERAVVCMATVKKA